MRSRRRRGGRAKTQKVAQAVASIAQPLSAMRRLNGARPLPACVTRGPSSASTIVSAASLAMASTSERARVLHLGDAQLRRLQLLAQSALDAGALAGDLRLRLLARRMRDGMRVLAGLGERLLIGGDGRVGLLLQPAGLGEVAGDAVVALREDRADARQRHAAHQEIEQPEEDREPEELRAEGRGVERRERAMLPAMRLRALMQLARRRLQRAALRCAKAGVTRLNIDAPSAIRPRLKPRRSAEARSAARRCRAPRSPRSRRSGGRTGRRPRPGLRMAPAR